MWKSRCENLCNDFQPHSACHTPEILGWNKWLEEAQEQAGYIPAALDNNLTNSSLLFVEGVNMGTDVQPHSRLSHYRQPHENPSYLDYVKASYAA